VKSFHCYNHQGFKDDQASQALCAVCTNRLIIVMRGNHQPVIGPVMIRAIIIPAMWHCGNAPIKTKKLMQIIIDALTFLKFEL
jgi:hypothetical protein